MKVAIMGAGLSGLTCAIVLERNGLKPTIYEKMGQVGDRFINAEAFMSILNRPIHDVIRYITEEFHIDLKPVSHIAKLNIHTENSHAKIEEHIGFINIRGRHQFSFEMQLLEQLKSDIHFNSSPPYDEISKEFSHVVLATGDSADALQLHNYRKNLSVSLKGATVRGEFDRYTATVWLNHNYAPKGYGYILPFSEHEANLVTAHPNLSTVTEEDQQKYWDALYQTVQTQTNQSLPVTDQFQITNFVIGSCIHPRIGNTFFTGNNFGAIMPFIGFGQFVSILTGIYAAYDILGYGSYEELTKPLRKSYERSLVLRQVMESLSNNQYDHIVSMLNGKLGKRIFKPSNQDPLKYLSYFLRFFVRRS
ncbi:NAD(P)-binding protein [Salinibacillus xinjiangensis]|uniref:NAD(P)-binding protein n=1 Tax=Salinibacillus xinjiangensis TaxID=1229268 RepID=A0A6G1X7L8_9BACI|nr:NAD(P)/FAD-dependent oxidoreductase [Salinibacillus xinjiangensis]MRG86870.1 NAD(P)-binding protein [Salinibacillus xinjiangensis]